jgi:predicted CoA-substrate-specific enzyme activase
MKKIAVDLGSRFIKIAVLKEGGYDFHMESTVEFYKKYIRRGDKGVYIDLDDLGIETKDASIISTGYGRYLMNFVNAETISEIKAHFFGAKAQTGESNFTLVDIGGQDSKVIQARDGYINDFSMNDKCAASTGRFIEQAARILDIPIEEFIKASESPAKLTDTCAIFCESELIGLLAQGERIERLASGVNLSVARRMAPQLIRYKSDKVFAAGGVAGSTAILGFLMELTRLDIAPLPIPQYNGAIGGLNLPPKY